MSYSVSAATLAAVSASISTPVRAVARASARMVTVPAARSGVSSTSTRSSGSGWQSGMSSEVRFAPPIPASRAVTSASPFGPPASSSVGEHVGAHADGGRGHGAAGGDRLVADVDHARRALVVEVARLHRTA